MDLPQRGFHLGCGRAKDSIEETVLKQGGGFDGVEEETGRKKLYRFFQTAKATAEGESTEEGELITARADATDTGGRSSQKRNTKRRFPKKRGKTEGG